MESIVEKLKKYFETTSDEQVLKDWEKTKEFDEVGPIMDDFLNQTNWYFKIKIDDPMMGYNHIINNYSPKFSSGFFLINLKKYATSSIFNCKLSV
ncbi:MAG: hypothetical protein R2798_00215 [Chitinophagales bacterium]|nr:hypothetical protein [Bacteroidota bacterium]MCB9043823.1 hypothetical protein [Chitinophagales bacterium]